MHGEARVYIKKKHLLCDWHYTAYHPHKCTVATFILGLPCIEYRVCVSNILHIQSLYFLAFGVLSLLDIDECLESSLNTCHQLANCSNNDGSYVCTCSYGYTGSGHACTGMLLSCCMETVNCHPLKCCTLACKHLAGEFCADSLFILALGCSGIQQYYFLLCWRGGG